MEKKTKDRLLVLGILAAAGLLAIEAGAALGAESIFTTAGKDIRAVVNGSQVTIYEDDEEVHNFTLPEGQNYTWEVSTDGDEIEIHLEHESEELDDSQENELNETEHEDSHENEVNETEHEDGLNEIDEDELETHGTQESELNEGHESGNEGSPELQEEDETQGSEAED